MDNPEKLATFGTGRRLDKTKNTTQKAKTD